MADIESLMPAFTVDVVIFDMLSADELCRFRRVCKAAKDKVDSYFKRRFSLLPLLQHFFTTEQSMEFWSLMATTGMLISGSSALQFFDRMVYPASDLDIYMEQSSADTVANWLLCSQYQYLAIGDPAPLMTDDGQISPFPVRPVVKDQFKSLTHPSYSGAIMVLNFERKEDARKVQLIITDCCPLQMILRFHSTVVLNLISHNKAYCLYPMATLVERRGVLQVGDPGHDRLTAVQKYVNRGWTITFDLEDEEWFDPMSSLSPGPRRLGDSRCWTIDLQPKGDLKSSDNIEANRWIVDLQEYEGNVVKACIFVSDCLDHGYLVSPSVSMRDALERFQRVKADKGHNWHLDSYCTDIFG